MKKFNIKKGSLSFLLFLFATSVFFFGFIKAEASIFAGVLSLFSKNKNTTPAPYIDVNSFLLKPGLAKAETVSTKEEEKTQVREDGVFLVQSGSLRVSTEKEKIVDDTINIYEVKKGDTLESIAKLFNINKNTIIWANELKGKTIKEGDTLLIFPMNGIQYTVKNSGTIEDIAKKYKADAEEIAQYNGLALNAKLSKGDVLFIPDAEAEIQAETKKPKTKVTPKYKNNVIAGYFMKPVTGCVRTQGLHGPYGTAVDYGCKIGTATVAAAAGTVLRSTAEGYNGGYGGVIIISHPNGTQTIYAHMNTVNVVAGQKVEQGQVIGTTGNTGRSTGPHLHFETRGTGNPF